MAKIQELQLRENFVGRDSEIKQLKGKIERNGVVVLTGERGIGKSSLMEALVDIFDQEKTCHIIERGSALSSEVERIFKKSKLNSLSVFDISFGIDHGQHKPSLFENLENSKGRFFSKERVFFVKDAHLLDENEFRDIFAVVVKNNELKFVLEVATPYIPEFPISISKDQLFELRKLNDNDIKKIVVNECPVLRDSIVEKVVFQSAGYPYIAIQLAYICDEKNVPEEMLEFLNTLEKDDLKHNIDTIHKQVLKTLKKDGEKLIKKIAIAPPLLTLDLIWAFCGEDIDTEFNDIEDRGILRHKNKSYEIYHPLFREYLRRDQKSAMKKEKITKTYEDAMEKVSSQFDSIAILTEALKQSDVFDDGFFEKLVEISENSKVLSNVASRCFSLGKLNYVILLGSRNLKISDSRECESLTIGNMGIVFKIQGDLPMALEHFQKALKIYEELSNMQGMANQFRNMADVFQIQGDLPMALEYYEYTMNVHGFIGNLQGMASDYGNMGIVFHKQGNLPKALKHYEKALKINEATGNMQGMADQLSCMCVLFENLGDFPKALEHSEKALEIYREFDNMQGMANQFGNMGIVFLGKGDFPEALKHHEKALKINEEIGNMQGMADQFGNMGIVFKKLGNLPKALEHYEKAMKIDEGIGNMRGMASDYGNMAIVFKTQGDFPKALEHYRIALIIYGEIGDMQGVANQFDNMGLVFQNQGNFPKALEHHEKALKIYEEIGNNYRYNITMNNKINSLLKSAMKNNKENAAEKALHNLWEIAECLNATKNEHTIIILKVAIFNLLKDLEYDFAITVIETLQRNHADIFRSCEPLLIAAKYLKTNDPCILENASLGVLKVAKQIIRDLE